MSSSEDIQREAQALSNYLLKEHATESAVALYTEALSAHPVPLTGAEKKLWQLALRFPFLIPFIDAGLATQQKNASIRRRIFIFSALLKLFRNGPTTFCLTKKTKLKLFFLLLLFLIVQL